MAYLTKVVPSSDLLPLLDAALSEYDAKDRLERLGWSAEQYFAHCDKRAESLSQPVTYVAVRGDGDHGDYVGFARYTLENTLPGYQSLPGDKRAICLDEVYVLPAFRARGVFPVLVDAVRKLAMAAGATYVYARVINNGLSRAFQGYGMGHMPLLIGTLRRLKLPDARELSEDTGDWSAAKRVSWNDGSGARETGSRNAVPSELHGRFLTVQAKDGGF